MSSAERVEGAPAKGALDQSSRLSNDKPEGTRRPRRLVDLDHDRRMHHDFVAGAARRVAHLARAIDCRWSIHGRDRVPSEADAALVLDELVSDLLAVDDGTFGRVRDHDVLVTVTHDTAFRPTGVADPQRAVEAWVRVGRFDQRFDGVSWRS